MVGIGETDEEVVETLRDLRSAGVDIVTLGQYLRPTPKHHEVVRYVTPETFAEFEKTALSMRSEEHTSELQSRRDLVCRLLLEKKKKKNNNREIQNEKGVD